MNTGGSIAALPALQMPCIGAAVAQLAQETAPVARRLAAGVGCATAVRLSQQPAADEGRMLPALKMGFAAVPRLAADGRMLHAATSPPVPAERAGAAADAWRAAQFQAPLKAGANRVAIGTPAWLLDRDALDIEAIAP
ncbi:hypothetical protein JR065_11685 [Xanthomonas sp. AmX2]|uniref:hypothetical protein n=1 Tax=Xanthomonas sp. TaxID=29446 RepID=UPI00197F1F8A|nr:hypothetical protein [Xanthomonas sp.]MBN6151006.1 hypothetical protein [Xanthomonas sp.]